MTSMEAANSKMGKDERPYDDAQDKLKWRADPEESHSDWTIEIVSGPEIEQGEQQVDPSVEKYYVHKFFLAFGARRSQYFVSLFNNGISFRESESCTSRIELEPLAAKAFPQVLDFLYWSTEPLDIDSETATALYFLGEYLDMRNLRYEAMQFIKKDISLKTIDTYCEHAKSFHCDKIMEFVTSFLEENILEVPPNSKIIQVSDPQLWVQLLESGPNGKTSAIVFSLHMSEMIAEYGMAQSEKLDLETFLVLTNADKMPNVSHNAALKLMEVAEAVMETLPDASKAANTKEMLADLQERCVTTLSQHWEDLTLSDPGTKLLLDKREPDFLVRLLTKTRCIATQELKQCNQSLSEARNTNHRLQERMSSLISNLDQNKQEKYRLGQDVKSLKWELSQAQKETAKLQERMSSLISNLDQNKQEKHRLGQDVKSLKWELSQAQKETARLLKVLKGFKPVQDHGQLRRNAPNTSSAPSFISHPATAPGLVSYEPDGSSTHGKTSRSSKAHPVYYYDGPRA
jgi:hypothetical protein